MISKKLIHWFNSHARDLPWRSDRTPYKIWISEVMLQQTQVKQVIPYFYNFIDQFPDVSSLSGASLQQVLKVWQGMGYYARARNIHRAAKIIVNDFNSQFPRDREVLIKLPGFGPYTTNALLSLAFNKPYAVMDGNVVRVITRLYKIRLDIRLSNTQKTIQKKIDTILDPKNPAIFNEAMMELGATICHPVNPDCTTCPLIENCITYKNKLISEIPFKSTRQKRPVLQVSTYIVSHLDQILLAKRPDNGLLGGLWEFPTYRLHDFNPTSNHTWIKEEETIINGAHFEKNWEKIHHAYTHFHVKLTPSWYHVKRKHFESDFYTDYKWIKLHEISGYPIHKAIQKVIDAVSGELEIVSQ